MTDSMIEKVGAAIARELKNRRGFRQIFDGLDEDIESEVIQALGRAAIEAMREPSPEMVDAGDEADPSGYGVVKEVWPAMIDAALEPPK